jgi:hypothetical protein
MFLQTGVYFYFLFLPAGLSVENEIAVSGRDPMDRQVNPLVGITPGYRQYNE